MNDRTYQPALLIDGGPESLADAVAEVAKVLGGKKKLALMVWPAKGDSSHSHLLDCLNPDRPHKLSPDELVRIARLGREQGCDAVVRFFCQESGYEVPKAKNVDELRTELQTRIAEGLEYLKANMQRLDLLEGANTGAPRG